MTPKIGDRFKLGIWEWVVDHVDTNGFFKIRKANWPDSYTTTLMHPEDADFLEWIKPEVTFTKEQGDVVMDKIQHLEINNIKQKLKILDSMSIFFYDHTEK